MGAATIVTLLGVAIAVAAIASYLIIIAYTLNKVSFILGTVLIGVRSIASQVEPVGGYIDKVYGDVSAIQRAVTELLALVAGMDGSRPTSRRSLARR